MWGRRNKLKRVFSGGICQIFDLKYRIRFANCLNLHEHQIHGVKRILQWHNEKHGGIIADEMGLGKTCQVVGSIVCLLNDNKAGRHMIVCPLSVLQHWQNELLRLILMFKLLSYFIYAS
ncbi:unnamed protein product [Onchocerca flexuosa]|uniref:SNF2_N domain-containing protein n=1 Tax=Onchocerca flexuosa TaxID=387005 RepID=A0A183HV21_9BILA|nr:unnamed protein product [Onchocerca flexuosa]